MSFQWRSSLRLVQGDPTLCACSRTSAPSQAHPFPFFLVVCCPSCPLLLNSPSVFPGPYLSFTLLASSRQFNQKKKKKKCLNVREKQNTARRANESASWGRQTQATQGPRGLPGAVPTRTSPPPGGVDQRPPDGLRKCSCQESEASLWSSRLRRSLPGGRWRMPHLLIICARQDCLPTCPST